jgi:hypothetical protein
LILFISCSKEEISANKPAECNCGKIINKEQVTNEIYEYRVLNYCSNNSKLVESTYNYNLNDKYCVNTPW